MNNYKTLLFASIVASIVLSLSFAYAKPAKGLKAFAKEGTIWTFEKTMETPNSASETTQETWTLAQIDAYGKGAQKAIFVILEDLNGRERDFPGEFIVDGSRLHDVSWLEHTRPFNEFSPEELKSKLPILDLKKAKKGGTVIRYPDNARAWVRYEKLARFKASNGTTYTGVYAVERNRGPTENTDRYWIHPKHGIVQAEMVIPTLGGGGKHTWKRTN